MRTFFLSDGTPPTPLTLSTAGDRLVQADLARTLRELAAHGASVLYEGDIGQRLVAELQANGGLLITDDLANYAVREFSPGLEMDYRGHRLIGLSQTSGSMTTFEALKILRHFDLAQYGSGSAHAVHLVAEACRRAFLDRFAYLADTDLEVVPVEGLLSDDYAAEVASTIALDRANAEARPGDPWRYQLAGDRAIRPGATAERAGGEGCTTHVNAVDGEHNMVALGLHTRPGVRFSGRRSGDGHPVEQWHDLVRSKSRDTSTPFARTSERCGRQHPRSSSETSNLLMAVSTPVVGIISA